MDFAIINSNGIGLVKLKNYQGEIFNRFLKNFLTLLAEMCGCHHGHSEGVH